MAFFMVPYKLVCLLLIVGLMPGMHSAAFAETSEEIPPSPWPAALATTGRTICRAFLRNPERFRPVKMQACEYQYSYMPQATEGMCFSHSLYDSPEKVRFFASHPGLGCKSLSIVNTIQDQIPKEIATNITINGYSLSPLDEVALDYRGTLLLSDERLEHLILPLSSGLVVLCEFVHRFEGWEAARPADNPVCQKLEKGEFSEPGENISGYFDNTHLQKLYHTDFDHDGIDENITKYSFSTGSGCGCTYEYLDITHEDGRNFISLLNRKEIKIFSAQQQKIGRALLDLDMWECKSPRDITWSVVKIDHRDYLLRDMNDEFIKREQDQTIYSNLKIKDRTLYALEGSAFVPVCTQKARSTRMIQHEIPGIENWELSYTPLWR
jgi:hypothetical protein